MLFGIVCITDVVVVNLTAAVFIEDFVSFLDEGDTLRSHGAFHNAQEFVIVNGPIAVLIECSEESLDVHMGELEARLSAAFSKLLQIEGTGAIIIHNLEDTTNTYDRASASGQHLLAESLD